MRCDGCKIAYPFGYLMPVQTSDGPTPPLCGVCALEWINRETGLRREKFDGEVAESLRLKALRFRQQEGLD